jgi:hypothetical protein
MHDWRDTAGEQCADRDEDEIFGRLSFAFV